MLSKRRLMAVQLRLDGHTVAETAARTALSAPTVSAAWKAFKEGGWEAVPVRQRGRPAGQAAMFKQALHQMLAESPASPLPGWSSRALAEWLQAHLEQSVTPRSIEHWWAAQGFKVDTLALEALEKRRSTAGRWYRQQVKPVQAKVEQADGRNWQGGIRVVAATIGQPRIYQLYLHGKRGALFMRCFSAPPLAEDYITVFERLLAHAEGPVSLVFHGAWFQASPDIQAWLSRHTDFHLVNVPAHNDG